MWLAEEEMKYTTVITVTATYDTLWLAEEEMKYTTFSVGVVLQPGCGLLKKR